MEKLNIEKELSKTKIKQQYFIIYGFIGIFVLIVFVLFLIIRQFQQKKAANKLLRSQNDIITVQKKEITDSINYARHIQTAILPSELTIKKYLPDSFVLYKPRDIVSGDFYWITEKANRIIYTAADSTGHGVPGAFMSIIGSLLLDITVEEITSMNAADILSNLKNRLVSTLNRDGDKVVQDGMDMALIVLDKSEEKLVIDYAGANNPLYIINKGELQEIKPTKMPVGFYNGDKNRTFINNRLNLQKSDLLYIFSDGYADQFGGPNGKKFKYKQLKNLLLEIHHLNLQEQKLILDQKFEDWKGEHEQVDDVIVMGIRV
ncbi:MAG: hypothetical protein C0594_17780 [Marinilabiliales bacterium]|nr:MAG: hypothetical protein C0594_17780 [Marinilabiliales bacterium]